MSNTEELTDEMKAAIIARIEAEIEEDIKNSTFNGQPRKDFMFQTSIGKFLFETVAWSEPTVIRFIPYLGNPAHTVYDLEMLFNKYTRFNCKLNRSIQQNSAEDFRFCLCTSRIEFSCTNKPVITPFFDFDGLSGEELKRRQELKQKYRNGLMPSDITCEFPVSIPYKGKDISCIVRFRDTSWYEIDRFTVALAKGEPVPAGWQKNEYDEYAFPNDDLWEARGFSKIFPAYDMQCSPYRMYLRLGKTRPLDKDLSNIEEPPNLPMLPF